jgi:PAS domain S-box-containing protein
MMNFIESLLSSDGFMPHGFCYLWNAKLVWLHVISDSLIALAYFSIPVTLIYFIRKRRDLPFNWIFVCFGLFILACGSTHLMEVWTLWHANYWFSGAIKAFTAMASVPTAILLVDLVPEALRLPSPKALRDEIAERKCAQEALIEAKNELERRVQERTADLTNANEKLIAEIEQRKLAEDGLRRSEERFRLLIEGVEDYAIFSLDPSGRVTSWNAGAEHIKGYLADEIIGRHFSDFYSLEDKQCGKPELALQVAAAEGRFAEEDWRVRKDGSRLWASVVITALRDSQEKLIGFSKITRDLTERKRAEEKLQAAQAQLSHVARVTTMGEFAASIAHEVNQPLSAALANGDACLRWLGANPPNLDRARASICGIVEAVNRASEVIKRIRALMKKAPPQKTELNVNEVVREVSGLLLGELARNDVLLQMDLAPDLPVVFGDQVQMQQVILNLISNAMEAMKPATQRPKELLISSHSETIGRVLVSIRDSGTGFGPEFADNLFQAFFTTKQEGMGLGLSISRTIIEAHGGRLWATANIAHGATFQFSLPVAEGMSP